ncbi:hypothetical protein [Cohnella soli]|uniref:Uncharacterized protein n=1 Tax=Cohnella soli TaxID=425005 RepID=A0ABW0HLP4_9BACL
MEIPEEMYKDFLSILLQSNLHRKIELDLVYDVPQRETFYILKDYAIEEYFFEDSKYINLTLTLALSDNMIFTYPIPWISNVEYNPEGTIVQDKIKIWIIVTNIAKKRNLDIHTKHGITHLLKSEDQNIFNKTRLFIYPDFSDFASKVFTDDEGMKFCMAELVYVNPIFKGRSFKKMFNKVAVLIPFQKEFSEMYSNYLVPEINKYGFEVNKGDDFYDSNVIIEDIWRLINESNIVVADLTGKNPNVFYEVGIAHTLGKHVVLLSQNSEDIPFDLRHLRNITYSLSSVADIELFKKNIGRVFQEIEKKLNIPRDIQDAVISEKEIYRVASEMRSATTVYAFEETTKSMLLFVKIDDSNLITLIKNQRIIGFSSNYSNENNCLIIKVYGMEQYDYAPIIGFIPIDKRSYNELIQVAHGKAGLYFIAVNLEQRLYSVKPIYYDEFNRHTLLRLLEAIPKSRVGEG